MYEKNLVVQGKMSVACVVILIFHFLSEIQEPDLSTT